MGIWALFQRKKLMRGGLDPHEMAKRSIEARKKGMRQDKEAFSEFLDMAKGMEKFKQSMLDTEKSRMELIKSEMDTREDDGMDLNKVMDLIKMFKQQQMTPTPDVERKELDISNLFSNTQVKTWVSWAKDNRKEAHNFVDKFLDR